MQREVDHDILFQTLRYGCFEDFSRTHEVEAMINEVEPLGTQGIHLAGIESESPSLCGAQLIEISFRGSQVPLNDIHACEATITRREGGIDGDRPFECFDRLIDAHAVKVVEKIAAAQVAAVSLRVSGSLLNDHFIVRETQLDSELPDDGARNLLLDRKISVISRSNESDQR